MEVSDLQRRGDETEESDRKSLVKSLLNAEIQFVLFFKYKLEI